VDSPFLNKEIWFLTGSQDLYGDDVLAQVAEQSRAVVAMLEDSGIIPVPITWKPVLRSSDAIHRLVLEAAADERCIGLITWMHTFSPAKMWIRGLGVLATPLLQLHTQANLELPWSSIDMDFMNLNQAAHGDREFGYILSRTDIPRKIVVGHASDPRVAQRIAVWARAAAACDALQTLNLVRFGDNMRRVAVTDGDKTEAEIRFGTSIDTWGVDDLADAVDNVAADAVDILVDEYCQLYTVPQELASGGACHASLRYAARLEAGLSSFLTERGSRAFTTNFEDLGRLRQLPGLAVQRLMAEGFGFGAEGDWKTALLVRAAKVMGFGLPGGASLMEDYTYDLTPGGELVLGAHMLEICPSLTTTRPRAAIHPLTIGNREDPVRLVFQADPGPGVVVAMIDMRERFRMVANVVELVASPRELSELPVAHAVWSPKPDLPTSAAAWLLAGAAHHTVLSTAVDLEAFEDLARMTRIELVSIDGSTTQRDVERELRWNAAYYRSVYGS